jgi:hypothetical protein
MEDLQRLKRDRKSYQREQLKIGTKRGIEALILNPIQEKIEAVVAKLESENKPVRVCILKARREGVSTYIASYIFQKTTCNPNTSSLITAHIPKSTRDIFEIYRIFYEFLHPLLRPMRRYNNRTELIFDNPSDKNRPLNPGLMSNITVATSNVVEIGRGSLYHHYHGSEVAFYAAAKKLMNSVFQSVPPEANTSIWLETTGNGVGEWFQRFFYKALRGENEFIPLFFAWFDFPEYVRDVTLEEVKTIRETLDDEEKTLRSHFKLSWERLAWRRWAINNKCQGDLDLFHQEYPSTVEEAFISSGRPVFNRNKLLKFKVKKGRRGYLESREFIEDRKGELVVYHMPNPKYQYILGGDVAEGKLIETESEADNDEEVDDYTRLKGDWSVLTVINATTLNVVAKLRTHCDPDVLGDKAVALGRFYNTAFIAIESNPGGGGLSTNKQIYKLHYPKRRIYFSRVVDRIKNIKTKKIGFRTTSSTRRLIIAALKAHIRTMAGELYDAEIINECMTFIVTENGREEAEKGCYDDCVISLAIAIFITQIQATYLLQITQPTKKLPTKGQYWDHLIPRIPFMEE